MMLSSLEVSDVLMADVVVIGQLLTTGSLKTTSNVSSGKGTSNTYRLSKEKLKLSDQGFWVTTPVLKSKLVLFFEAKLKVLLASLGIIQHLENRHRCQRDLI